MKAESYAFLNGYDHWSAMMSGNLEIGAMVQALSKFYKIGLRACLQTPSGADLAEFSFMARNFREGVPGVRQAEVTK
ncbi:hypothetical protein DQG13_25830 [Paenibacillus sp. YN15]|nr:hypothetical protein DQG13_25830 [Paenibacillus sp. YN15]